MTAAPKFPDHFSQAAAKYAQFRPTYPKELFAYLAGVSPSRRLAWDCACGSGQATLDLAEHFDHVIATDASSSQVAAARSHPKIEYRVAPAESSGLDDASIDLIIVAQALHWFDVDAFYREAARVLRPAATLAVWTYAMSHFEGDEVEAICQDFYSRIIGPYWPPERKIVEDEYRSLPFPTPELTAPKFQMRTHWTIEQLLGYFSSWSGTKNYIQQRGETPMEPLGARLEAVWGGADRRRIVEWPLTLRVWRKP